MVAMKQHTIITTVISILLFSITVLSQEPKLECTKENLLLAVQKAVRQLPEVDGSYTMSLTMSGGSSISRWPPEDKYASLTYQQRLDAIAKDKEKEAKEARELADRERTRVEDIRFIRKIVSECKEIK